jgi:hypothetical protein
MESFLEVDKITFFNRGPRFKRGADCLFGGKEGRGTLFLTGVENTGFTTGGEIEATSPCSQWQGISKLHYSQFINSWD